MRKGLYNNIWGILFWALYTHRVPGPKRLQLSRARQKRGRGGEKIAAQRREAMPKVTPSKLAALLGAQHGRPGHVPLGARCGTATSPPRPSQDEPRSLQVLRTMAQSRSPCALCALRAAEKHSCLQMKGREKLLESTRKKSP